ncbi:Na+/H+ antiporter subunit G [Reinekea marinisedimentorum]|uniref:Multicomponent K+:H+ antiporter subunit G n=1 Tax=Reinekea marinisedimentorum TaxID=230495 RepID=A0A4R3IEA0_9GAMM|nr:Na+/H+ antiporter subunit G [Reinekea marinisedimentorum]TCS44087.1 multicomponent K+:H+ antiporter subunit G [Reinekea marinisedimentorum]
MIVELISSIFLIIGGVFLLVGSVGLFRLPDFYMRLHAPTKASTLGIGAILVASIIFFSFKEEGINIQEMLITLFIFLTAPITAHMLSKAALHVRLPTEPHTLNRDKVEQIRTRQAEPKD